MTTRNRAVAMACALGCAAALAGCGSSSSEDEASPDASSAEKNAVVEDYVAAFNAEDVEAVMATMSPSMDRLTPEVVECEHEAVFAQADATLVVDAEADATSGARGYEVSDADGEVRDSGTITFVFADDGLLNGTTFPVEVGLDFGVDFSACAPTE